MPIYTGAANASGGPKLLRRRAARGDIRIVRVVLRLRRDWTAYDAESFLGRYMSSEPESRHRPGCDRPLSFERQQFVSIVVGWCEMSVGSGDEAEVFFTTPVSTCPTQ